MVTAAAAPALPRASRVGQVWRYRELLRGLIVRNLKVKYQRSVLGFVWTLVNPLMTVAILVVVFSHVVRIALPHYWAFLLSGYFVWNFLLQMLSSGAYVGGASGWCFERSSLGLAATRFLVRALVTRPLGVDGGGV